jgi:hypothetical protein
MTVYVVNRNRDDLSDAERYGEIKFINLSYVYPDEMQDNGELPQAVMDNIQRCADDFHIARDYLVIVGDHVQLLAMTAALAQRCAWFRVLRYDRQEKAYFPVVIRGRISP